MFEVGKLVARIAMEGAETFRRDVKSIGEEFTGLSDKGRRASSEVGTGLAVVGGSITALAALAVTKFADFDKAMSEVGANTDAPERLDDLRQAALEMGADTKYSATEAAEGIVELSKAGVSADQVIRGGLAGSLALAAAGNVSVADAAETAATAMTQFRLSGEQVPHIADLLAAGANKAQGGVEELSGALKQSGLVASQMGLSVEDTVGTLTAFASAGLIGSDAGTSFRTMLLSLANPTAKSSELMKDLGISAYDAQGNFVGMSSVAGQLSTVLGQKTQAERDSALATIFGSDAIRAANVLYNQGAEGIQQWTDAVDEAGFAAQQAAALQDNLAGDVEKLGGAFDTALIQAGSASNEVLRAMVQILTAAIDAYGSLPEPIQQAGFVVVALAGGLTLLGGAFFVLLPKMLDFKDSLKELAKEMPRTAGVARGLGLGLGAVGIAAAGVAVVYGMYAARQADVKAGADSLTTTLDQQTGAFTDNTRATVANLLEQKGAFGNAARAAGISQKELTDAVLEGGDALDKVRSKLSAENTVFSFFDGTGIAAGNASQSINEVADSLDQAKTSFENTSAATEGTSTALQGGQQSALAASDAYVAAADGAGSLTDRLTALIDTVNEANGVGQDAVSANIAYQDALRAADEQIAQVTAGTEGYAATLDIATDAGSRNMEVLLGIAQSGQDAAKAQFDLDGNTQAYKATLDATHQAVYDRAIALGANADQAQAVADNIASIPTDKEWTMITETAAAESEIRRVIDLINSVPEYRRTSIGVSVDQTPFYVPQSEGSVRYYASGGENHVAQIARAGDYRVWAEDETGGEAYIPLAPAKRERSTAILESVASQFGLALVPAGARSTDSAPGSASASLTGLRIAGTLDLGEGLIGRMQGMIMEALDSEDDDAKAGVR